MDFSNSERLRKLVPSDKIFVAESGVKKPADVVELKQHDIHVALIGETLMRSDDKQAMIRELKEA